MPTVAGLLTWTRTANFYDDSARSRSAVTAPSFDAPTEHEQSICFYAR